MTATQLDKEVSPVILSADPAVISPDPSTLSIGEGEARIVTARLSYPPTANVTVTITKQTGSDADINTLSTTLTFTPTNWNQPQKVVFTAQDDTDALDGTATYTFSMPGFVDKTLAITEKDNDAAPVTVSTDQLPVLEGNFRTFDVSLPYDPLDKAVIVNIVRDSGSSDLQASQTTLVFVGSQWVAPSPNPYPNATLWNVKQTVTVKAISDPNSDNETATFRISAAGYTDALVVANAIEKVQSIRPLGNAFRVNTFTVDAQFDPAVTMDSDGNFVITWSNQGQDISFFNGIVGQRFNRDGDRVGNEFMVNDEDTHTHDDSYVSLSPDGQFFIVTWVMNGASTAAEPGSLMVKVYNMRESDIVGYPTVRFAQTNFNVFGVDTIAAPTAAWDSLDDFVITWDWPQVDADHTTANPSDGTYGIMFDINGFLIRTFRVNSGSIDPATLTSWPNGQSGNQVATDTDGDITVVYSGFGPDASENTIVAAQWYNAALQQMQIDPLFANSPLLDLLSDLVSHGLSTPFHPFVHDGSLHPVGDDTDLVIQEFMTIAYNFGATQTQLGRLQQIMSNVANLMRGDANGVMFTQYDADPVLGTQNVLNTDNIVNSYRDGTNDVLVIAVDQLADDGDIDLYDQRQYSDYESIRFLATYSDRACSTIDPDQTATAIHDALTTAYHDIMGDGLNWPEDHWTPNGLYEGPFDVRVIGAGEWYARQNTPWELNDNSLSFNPNLADIGKLESDGSAIHFRAILHRDHGPGRTPRHGGSWRSYSSSPHEGQSRRSGRHPRHSVGLYRASQRVERESRHRSKRGLDRHAARRQFRGELYAIQPDARR